MARMKLIAMLALAAVAVGAAHAAETLKVFGREWTVYNAADWKADRENGTETLRLTQGREPLPVQTKRAMIHSVRIVQ